MDVNYIARGFALATGFPVTIAASIVNWWCSSGLLAALFVENEIIAECIDVGNCSKRGDHGPNVLTMGHRKLGADFGS